MSTTINGAEHLNTPETARIIGIRPGTLRNWRAERRQGQPTYIRVGPAVLYKRAEVERFAREYRA
jgi:transposase-like protein